MHHGDDSTWSLWGLVLMKFAPGFGFTVRVSGSGSRVGAL